MPPPTTVNPGAEETQSEIPDHRALYSDTSDPGELYDSSEVDLLTAKPGTFTLDPDLFPGFDEELQRSSGHSDAEQVLYRTKVFSTERQLSPTGREIIRKFFTKIVPVDLPAGHSTFVFSESQVHAILRTIADEPVLSSFHMIKSLLVKVTAGIPLNKRPHLATFHRDLLQPAQGMNPVLEEKVRGPTVMVTQVVPSTLMKTNVTLKLALKGSYPIFIPPRL